MVNRIKEAISANLGQAKALTLKKVELIVELIKEVS